MTRVRFGLACAALVLAAVLVNGALAQSNPWRIVQASDGTLYVLSDGTRYAILGEAISDDELNAYVDGGPSGASLLLSGQTSGTGQPAGADRAPGAPQAQAPAAQGPQFVSVQGNSPGRTASVTVQANPGASCSISYTTPAGTVSRAAGLAPQSVGASGVATWSFLIGSATQRGMGSVSVQCDGATITSPITIG